MHALKLIVFCRSVGCHQPVTNLIFNQTYQATPLNWHDFTMGVKFVMQMWHLAICGKIQIFNV